MKNFEKFVKISFRENDYIVYPLREPITDKLPKYILWDSNENVIIRIDLNNHKKIMNKLFKNNPLKLL
jgi:hypothetical protein